MANKPCPKCGGSGSYMYDHNHAKICEVCCPHDQGWWQLGEEYHDVGKWCCRRGCGFIRDDPPTTEDAREKEEW